MTARRDGQALDLWRLQCTWLHDDAWMPAWARVVQAIGRLQRDWPIRLADAAPQAGPDARRHLAKAMLRPLLQSIADAGDLQLRAELTQFARIVFADPAPPSPAKPCATAADAKRALMDALATTASFRAELRRSQGWRRRAEVRWCVRDAFTRSRLRWWSGWPPALNGAIVRGHGVAAAAEQVRGEALAELELAGFRWPQGHGG